MRNDLRPFVLFIVSVFYAVTTLNAQLSDLARIEYVGIPDKGEGVGFNRYRAMFNYPIAVKPDAYVVVGLDYSTIDVTFENAQIPFDSDGIEDFQIFELNLGYTYKMKNDWRFAATVAPGFSSNLSSGHVTIDDATLALGVYFIKDKTKIEGKTPERLVLGISAANNRGFPVLPFISYYKKFLPKWSFNIGVPKTNLQYHMSEKHRLKAMVRLDGFNGFIQEGIDVEDKVADRFRARIILGGLRYEFKLTKHLEFYINTSYVLDSNAVLRASATEDVFEITEKGDIYIKTGIRFKV